MTDLELARHMARSAKESTAAFRRAGMVDGLSGRNEGVPGRPPSAAAVRAKRMLLAGKTQAEIRKATGLDSGSLSRLAKSLGIVRAALSPQHAAAERMLREGMSPPEVHRATGVARSTVRGIAARLREGRDAADRPAAKKRGCA